MVAAVAVPAVGGQLPGPAAMAAACQSVEPGGGVVRETPWPQLMLAPARARPFSTGAGVTVAVVDGGTDGRHPQLSGAVAAGFDLVENRPAGNSSCIGRGTAVASIIARRGEVGIGFRGFAPGAAILPVRIAGDEVDDDQLQRASLNPDRLAAGIRWAVDNGATVVNVSTALYAGSAELAAAVAYAYGRGVLVVAPVGDHHQNTSPDPVPYPAAYPGVLGVGAIEANGDRARQSQVGSYVDVVAPGVDVLGATLSGGYKTYSGTGYATAFVSATLALMRSAYPVVRRGADPAAAGHRQSVPGGGRSSAYGRA
jgi:membrane-anchored mycosin MYCP